MQPSANNLVWLDLEMTGLNLDVNRIIEIATIVTDPDLKILAEGPVLAIKQSHTLLQTMDKWNTEQHTKSGLLARVQQSTITEAEAEIKTLEFLQQYVKPGKSPMCGNTICQDRRFLIKYMPKLATFFHYRNLDVSTLKILAQRWAPKIYDGFNKDSKHLALEDIKDSITELAYYREHFLCLPEDKK